MKGKSFFFFEEIIMISSISSASPSQRNFNPNNIPPGTADFYNTVAFANNLSRLLSAVINQEEQAQLKGLQDIKKAIKGEN